MNSEKAPGYTAGKRLGDLASGDDVIKLPVKPFPGPTYVEGDFRPGPAVRTGGLMQEPRFWD